MNKDLFMPVFEILQLSYVSFCCFFLKNTDKAEVDKFFKMLDGDGDGVVNFQEFVTFVGAIATICK